MPQNTDNLARATEELVRMLEGALRAGVDSVGLEYEGRDLMVFYQAGPVGLGAARIPQELQQRVIAELVKRAGLSRKSRGKMRVSLLGKEYEVIVEEYDSFGESAYNLDRLAKMKTASSAKAITSSAKPWPPESCRASAGRKSLTTSITP